ENIKIDIATKTYKSKYDTASTNNSQTSTKNSVFIDIFNEDEANQVALYCLNFGAEALFFFSRKKDINWGKLLKDIELSYIHTWIQVDSKFQYEALLSLININEIPNITIFGPIDSLKNTNVNSFHLQQIGAPAYVEISYLLNELNHHLINQEKSEIEQSRLVFTLGLDGNYFLDMAKIRASKYLVNEMLRTYQVKPGRIEFHAHVGWTNKSLNDKDTNLLRQTTEVMAAYSSNLDAIFNNPSTKYSKNGTSLTDWRLSLNILNLLNEESYFSRVTNPIDGSYVFKQMVDQLIDTSWELFTQNQELSPKDFNQILHSKTNYTRTEKLKRFSEKNIIKIGINAYTTQENSFDHEWGQIPIYDGTPYLIFEKEL
ncbi:MAG: methylmalonyl-CoA mutase family protein, partial [Crocinitomicaceae bacterium]